MTLQRRNYERQRGEGPALDRHDAEARDRRKHMVACALCDRTLQLAARLDANIINEAMAAGWRLVRLEPHFAGDRSMPFICDICAEQFRPGRAP